MDNEECSIYQQSRQGHGKVGKRVGRGWTGAICNISDLWSRVTLCNITEEMMNKQLWGNVSRRRTKREEGSVPKEQRLFCRRLAATATDIAVAVQ